MIPVIGVPTLNRTDLLARFIDSIDHEIQTLLVIDNGGNVPDDCPGHVVRLPHNIGVGAAWNLIFKLTPRAPWWFICNDDIAFNPGELAEVERVMSEPGPRIGMLLGFAAFGINQEALELTGFFDENFHPAYCLAPETPVLDAGLKWRRIDEIEVGDDLVGLEEEAIGRERRFVRSTVTGWSERVAESVRVRLADGRDVICTTDHRWLSKPPSRTQSWVWRRTDQLGVGSRLMVPLDTWTDDRTYTAGWLAGIIDGEGCLHHTDRMSGIDISQRPGPVLDQIKRSLDRMGIPYTWRVRPSGVATVEVNSRRKAMELIGRTHPLRMMRPELWEGRSPRSRLYDNAISIVSIEPLGPRQVVSIETTSKTFIANGIVSHNCEDNDMSWRAKQAGVPLVEIDGSPTHEGSATIRGHDIYMSQNGRTFSPNLVYYAEKWGGRPGQEIYTTPFNKGGDIGANRLRISRLNEHAWARIKPSR